MKKTKKLYLIACSIVFVFLMVSTSSEAAMILRYDNLTDNIDCRAWNDLYINGSSVSGASGNHYFNGFELQAEFIISDDFSVVSITDFDVIVDHEPIIMNGAFDLGFSGSVPYVNTISNINLSVDYQGASAPLRADGYFTDIYMPFIISFDSKLEILGDVINTYISDTGTLHIEDSKFNPSSDLSTVGIRLVSYYGFRSGDQIIFDEMVSGNMLRMKVNVNIEDWHLLGTTTPVPIPGAVWLLGSGLIGIVGIRKKIKRQII